MKTRLLRRASAGALALTLIGATAAYADNIDGDADALATSAPAGNGLTTSQAIGSTVAYDLSATIDETGNSADDVFPGTVNVSINRSGAWLATDAGTPASFSFTDYNTNQAGKIRISVPCGTEEGVQQTMRVVLTAGASTNGKTLNPNSVTLTYAITATQAAPGACAPSDVAPVVTIDSVDAGPEGAAIGVAATVADDGVSPVMSEWSYAAHSGADAGATCSFGDAGAIDTTITCTDDGVYTVTLTATDEVGSGSDSALVTVSNADPIVTTSTFGQSNLSCGANNASLALVFEDAGGNDTHTVSVDWDSDGVIDYTGAATSPVALPHTYGAGVHTATVTVTDDDQGVSTAATAQAIVDYDMSGILQPINTTGSRSLFKYGSTIPVKVRILECDGTPALGLAPTLRVQKFVDGTPSGVDEFVGSTSAADSGNVLRYTGEDGIYIYNLATKSLGDSTAGYQGTVTIPTTGQMAQATFGLKK